MSIDWEEVMEERRGPKKPPGQIRRIHYWLCAHFYRVDEQEMAGAL